MSGGGWQLLNSITTSGAAMSQRRLFFTKFPNPALEPKTHKKLSSKNQKWTVKQVNRSNFATALEEIKTHILNSDYIAISLKKTGAFSSPWQKVLPIDTDQTAYLKAKYASEKFQVFQLAVCPFSLESSKVIAYPYNFHLFPRDELKLRMPSYSFSCQSSYLTSMANEGFDFNACIRDGISYLSRAQESTAKGRIENLLPGSFITQFEAPSTYSVADSMFTERIKARLKHWIGASRDSKTTNEDTLLSSLRKMISGNELFGSRPCLTIDVCSERQVLLALEVNYHELGSLLGFGLPGLSGLLLVLPIIVWALRDLILSISPAGVKEHCERGSIIGPFQGRRDTGHSSCIGKFRE